MAIGLSLTDLGLNSNTPPQTWRRWKQDDKFEDANGGDFET